MEFVNDVKHSLRDTPISIIFDVGANAGDVACELHRAWPSAKVYCFEPSSATYAKLKVKTAGIPGLVAERLAFSSTPGVGRISLGRDLMNKLISADQEGENSEQVTIDTLDDYCDRNCIEKIDLLKVDTEGFDLQVLMGAVKIMSAGRISILEVEVGMNPENTWHVGFEKVKFFLELYGYRVFKLYEQMHEWPSGAPHLRRVNALFVSPETIRLNTRS